MLLKSLLNDLKKFIDPQLKNKQKEILHLFFMTITQQISIHQSGLAEKYLKRIYRYFQDNKAHINLHDCLEKLWKGTTAKWAKAQISVRKKNPLIISVDDSVLEKHGKQMQTLRWLKDAQGHLVKGFNLLTITLAIDKAPALPVFVHWHKADCKETKIQIATVQLQKLIQNILDTYPHLDPKEMVVCFDSWYLCRQTAETLNNLGVTWVSKLRSNWNIAAEVSQSSYPVQQLSFWSGYYKLCKIKVKTFFEQALNKKRVFRIWHKSLSTCYATQINNQIGKTILVSNTRLRNKTLKRLYKRRWAIELMFRDLKQIKKIAQTHFVQFEKNKMLMEFKILIYALVQSYRINQVRYRKMTMGQLNQLLRGHTTEICQQTDTLRCYRQLSVSNKTQNPLE